MPELAEEIARRTASDEADGFYLNMKYFFLGRRIRHCGYAEAWNLRLFKHRSGATSGCRSSPGTKTGDNEAHEHVELAGPDPAAGPRARPSRLPDDRRLGREAQPLRRLGGRDVRTLPPTSRSQPRSGEASVSSGLLKKIYLRLPMRPLVRFLYSRMSSAEGSSTAGRVWSSARCSGLLRLPVLGQRVRAEPRAIRGLARV